MNASASRISTAVLFATAFVASANAEYRCAPAPTPLDQRACAAAAQGPDSLRRFVERWDSKMSNLYFFDYVDEKTAQSWAENRLDIAQKPSTEDRVLLASRNNR
jgi:hypothetical protein